MGEGNDPRPPITIKTGRDTDRRGADRSERTAANADQGPEQAPQTGSDHGGDAAREEDPSPDAQMDADIAQLDRDTGTSFRQFLRDHRRAFSMLLLVAVVIAIVLVFLPQIAGFGSTLKRLRKGNKSWLALGVVLEALSLGGYIAIFRAVFSCHEARITWSVSYQITLAGVVATKLLAAAGAGGVALTAWALRASGLSARSVARRITAFEILLYTVFMGSLVFFGVGLAIGLFPGSTSPAITLLPAAFGLLVIGLVIACRFIPDDIERRLVRLSQSSSRGKRVLERLATVPRTLRDGVVTAVELVRHPQIGLLGAVVYWGFDIATLWVSFRAFGVSPPVGVTVMAYFVGQLANAIPLPGGIGGVEGGMIGAFIAFGVNGSVAILAVLAYRALSFWLPTLPGAAAYFQLRRTVAQWRQAPDESAPAAAPVGR
ncbi:MAG: flippase-like domain-containing protein [Solirubrobacterales bacterium]|nr:flippase-like domain-containing protein [Solirubrobacterales bacterium]